MIGDKKAPYKSIQEGLGSPMGNNKGSGIKDKPSVDKDAIRSSTAPTPRTLGPRN